MNSPLITSANILITSAVCLAIAIVPQLRWGTFEEELAFREPIGVVRLARSVAGQVVRLFDMAQYPGPPP